MIYTQRNIADQECNKIKDLVQASTLNYFVKESPFTLQFTIRKTFIKDFSLVSSTNTFSTPSSQFQSTFSTNLECNPHSLVNDICGFQNDVDQQIQDIREELDKTKLESSNKITNLEKDIENKDLIIMKLKSKINSVEDSSKNLKNDLNVRNEQLKQNKNNLESLKQKNSTLEKECNTMKFNFSNKITNIEKKNKKLSIDSEKKISQLKCEIVELKNKICVKNTTKEQACQTQFEEKIFVPKHIQTDISLKDHHDTSSQTEKETIVDIAIQTNVESANKDGDSDIQATVEHTNKDDDSTTQINVEHTNKEETITFKKSRITSDYEKKSFCMSCFNDHSVKFPLDWPSRRYYFSNFLPISADQYEWPDKTIVDNYIEDFGEHKCEDCIEEDAPWKLVVCDKGLSTSYRASTVVICKNNLVEFGGLGWWEKTGIPTKDGIGLQK